MLTENHVEGTSSLQSLIEILNDNPDIVVEIPSKGEHYIFKRLSNKRRLATFMTLYLVQDPLTEEIFPRIYQQRGREDMYINFREEDTYQTGNNHESLFDAHLLKTGMQIIDMYLQIDRELILGLDSFLDSRIVDSRNNLTAKFPLKYSTLDYAKSKIIIIDFL